MRKNIIISLTFLVIFISVFINKGYSQDYDMVIKKSNLHYNEEYVIAYEQDSNISDSSQVAALIYTDLLQPAEQVEMTKIGEEWETEYVLSDTSVKMILFAFQITNGADSIDNNMGEYWSILVHNKDEQPVRGANLAEAVSYTGLGDLRETDLDLAFVYLGKELYLYPNNYSALRLKYNLQLRKYEYSSDIRREIDAEVTQMVNENPESEQSLAFALEVYRMIGNSEKAKEMEKRLIDLDPGGDRAAAQRLGEITKIEQPGVRLDSLEFFLKEFPDTRFKEFVLSAITTAAIEIKDYDKMKEVGDILLESAVQPAGAGSLAGIAGIFTEKKEDVKRAVLYAEKAVELARSFAQKQPPPGIRQQEWEEHNQRLQARYEDVLGWALYHYGKSEQAIRYLEKAASIMPQSSTYFHYGTALLMLHGPEIQHEMQKPDSGKESVTITAGLEEGLEYLAGAVAFGGEKGDQAYDLLQNVWIKAGRDTTELTGFIEKQTKKVEQEYERRILAKRDIRPAPDFDLENIQGDWVKLSDQQGVVIVLAFWATWSKSSLKMLNVLVELADVYGDSVLFITVSTDFDWRRANDFVQKTRFPLPVLLNDETDKEYDLYGVPAVFVIDKELNIYFEHKGYSDDIKEVLAVELDSLIEQ
ncbi:MAG: redoxin domain-containing protein [bacterium]